MYISNGIVYGGQPKTPVKITEIRPLDDMIMILTFTSGEQRIFDATALEGEVFEPLRDPVIFKAATLDHGVVTWMNGEIDCAPEFMYNHSYIYESIAI
ncbi:MAG: DUF2442 domain-containing protein [Brotaphodocola sp.]